MTGIELQRRAQVAKIAEMMGSGDTPLMQSVQTQAGLSFVDMMLAPTTEGALLQNPDGTFNAQPLYDR